MDYATLIAEHDRIDVLCNELLVAVSGRGDPTGAVVFLHELAFVVDEHLAVEDRLIYDRMWPSDDAKTRDAARKFVTYFEQLVADWGVYLSEWTNDVIEVDWGSLSRAEPFDHRPCPRAGRPGERIAVAGRVPGGPDRSSCPDARRRVSGVAPVNRWPARSSARPGRCPR